MAYEKTTWVSGETALSAEHMNNIEDGIKDLENQLNSLFKIVSYNINYTVAGNATKNVTAEEFGISTPNGYTPIAILRFSTGSAQVYVRGIIPFGTGAQEIFFMTNTSSSQINTTAYIDILYTKTDFISGS